MTLVYKAWSEPENCNKPELSLNLEIIQNWIHGFESILVDSDSRHFKNYWNFIDFNWSCSSWNALNCYSRYFSVQTEFIFGVKFDSKAWNQFVSNVCQFGVTSTLTCIWCKKLFIPDVLGEIFGPKYEKLFTWNFDRQTKIPRQTKLTARYFLQCKTPYLLESNGPDRSQT